MAGQLIRMGNRPNVTVCEFAVDTESEVQFLPTTTEPGSGIFKNTSAVPIASTCIVGNEGGELLVYILFSFGWKKIQGGNSDGGGEAYKDGNEVKY